MLTSKTIKETIGKFCFNSILIYHEIMYDAVINKTPRPVGPLLKGQGAMPRSPASLLTAISSHRLVAFPSKMSAFISHMRQKVHNRNLKWTIDLLPCYCYTTKTNSRIIRFQVWQPASAGKGADMKELQAHHARSRTVNLSLRPWSMQLL